MSENRLPRVAIEWTLPERKIREISRKSWGEGFNKTDRHFLTDGIAEAENNEGKV